MVYEFCAGRVVHARRKFDELIKHGHSEVTAEAVRRLAWVFKVEKQAREANSQGRLGLGKCLAQQHWDDLHAWMQRERQRVLDGSGIARTLDYSLNRWGALSRFLIDGEVSCHNNHLENLLRPWAMGRKAWLFAGSELRHDPKTGVIVKYNRKTVTVVTDDQHQWNVAPVFLSRVIDADSGEIATARVIPLPTKP